MNTTSKTNKAPSISRIEVGEFALVQLLDGELPVDVRVTLVQAVAAVNSLRRDVDASAHKPVRGEAANGDKFTVVCTCDWVPYSAPARNSMAMASFNTHLDVVGVRRDYGPGGNQHPDNS